MKKVYRLFGVKVFEVETVKEKSDSEMLEQMIKVKALSSMHERLDAIIEKDAKKSSSKKRGKKKC